MSGLVSQIAQILEPWAWETKSWNATVARDDATAKAEQIVELLAITTPKASAETGELPDVLPGHWTTPAGRDMALATLDDPHMAQSRERISDFALANEVFLSPGIANLTDAKERIRWLSATLAALSAAPSAPATEAGEEDRLRQALANAYTDGAREVHDYWKQCRPDVVFESEPDFSEAASDYARHALEDAATPTDQVKDVGQGGGA